MAHALSAEEDRETADRRARVQCSQNQYGRKMWSEKECVYGDDAMSRQMVGGLCSMVTEERQSVEDEDRSVPLYTHDCNKHRQSRGNGVSIESMSEKAGLLNRGILFLNPTI
ncbi:hypothetical protein AVEN_251549-1 [Araneus ventricosus]|uniref:Uncharacterized protein n=1 Tax=Araneus ventricosus TaxID=182803 RepID=A0A4Y2PY57_ARAVE|nr:hypothetical protein AVEN_251549-1 [Araneus ventricosus]